MRLILLASGFGLAGGQGPGHGIGKTTYAAQMDPLGAMAFVQKYFGTTAAADSCDADVCQCKAGESGASSRWFAYQGRSQLAKAKMAGHYPGKCVLRTRSAGPVLTGGTEVAVVPSSSLGEACSRAPGFEMAMADGDEGYVVNSHREDQCCKACAALKTCVGATYIAANYTASVNYTDPGHEGPGPQYYEGFGLHLAAVTAHGTAGGLMVEEVEAAFVDKMGNMTVFDAFMDFNVGLFTVNMDFYVKRFVADAVPYLGATWTTSSGDLMYSVFVHVPRSQMVVELIAASSQVLAAEPKLVPLEQRLSDSTIKVIGQNPPTGNVLKAVKVSRGATDLDALDTFYVNGMRAKKVYSSDGDDVSVRCYLWTNAETDLCFLKRPDIATAGIFKVRDFEQMLNRVADTMLTNPYCSMNRWLDNHYAYDSRDDLGYISAYLDGNPSVKFKCGGAFQGGLHYIVDPTGWGVQLDVRLSRQPAACSARGPPPATVRDDFCSGGACSAGPSPSTRSPSLTELASVYL